jgi:hypothetical protein
MDKKEPMMTDAQRDEIKRLCQQANVPDKSGELLTQQGAQHFIDDLRRQKTERQ